MKLSIMAGIRQTPEARPVFLAGNFGRERPETTPMKRRRRGHWQARLQRSPGRYEFKFLVDTRRRCRPGGAVEHGSKDFVQEVVK